ncbi:MAG: hypothetical protein NTV01_20190 [Bacteroidia bacterium]|nr:hypothetical protein [Bacteroidia bacterium]
MNLTLACPYCDSRFDVPCPNNLGATDDIKCVPYTRDIGRFDPKNDDEVFSKTGWSRIGKDYLPLLNWENIGILRIASPGLNIQYRVQKCSSCKNLFDVYANYSEEKLRNIWSHLFGNRENDVEKIKPYSGNSAITWLVRKSGKIFKIKAVGALVFGGVLLLISFLPWLFFHFDADRTTVTVLNFISKTTAAIGVVAVLILVERYFSYLSNSDEFRNLFDVKGENEFVHWRNYTLSRFIGVQKGKGFPQLTQSDYVVGILTILFLYLTWLLSKFHLTGFLIGSSILVAIIFVVFVYTFLEKKIKTKSWILGIKILIGIVIFLPIFSWAIVSYYKLDWLYRYDLINSLFDLFFWFICIYIFGIGIWISMGTCTYIMKGISVIPLKLSPFNRFANIAPLRKLHSYSSRLILVVFMTLTIVLTTIIFYNQPGVVKLISSSYADPFWIFKFLILVIGAIFIALGLGGKQFAFFYITAFYTIAILLLKNISFSFKGCQIDTQVLITALFFTSLLIFQFYSNESIIKKILTKKKEQAIIYLSNRIEILRKKIFTKDNIEIKSFDETIEYRATLEELERLMNFVREIEQVKITPNYLKEIAKFLAPVIISIATEQVVPKIIEKLVFN